MYENCTLIARGLSVHTFVIQVTKTVLPWTSMGKDEPTARSLHQKIPSHVGKQHVGPQPVDEGNT